MHSLHYHEGVNARLNGMPYLCCSYKNGTPQYLSWCSGWLTEDHILRTGEAPERDLEDEQIIAEGDKLKERKYFPID